MLRHAYPVVFVSLIIQCPLSSHPSGIGWPPDSRDRVSAACVLQRHQPICPCLQADVSILSCLTINDHAEKRGEMLLQLALLSTSNYDKPAGVGLSLYIRLSVVCCPNSAPPHPPTHPSLVANKREVRLPALWFTL